MPPRNGDIAKILSLVADLLEIEGANSFRVRAYRNAADTIERLPYSVADMVKEGRPLTEIQGVGPDLAGKIDEIVKTGKLAQLEEIEQRTPAGLTGLLRVGGLGPRRVQTLYQELGVKNQKDLLDAAEKGRIQRLPGFGKKIEKNILEDLQRKEKSGGRERIDKAEAQVEPLLEHLRGSGLIERIDVAGSFRRRKETVGDLDILAISESGEKVIDHFVKYAAIREVQSKGETRSTVVLNTGLQVDLRVVPRESYGAALHYFTGSKPHNLHLRNMALDRGWKVNEYGVYDGDKVLAGETEEGFYKLFGMEYVPPELREDTGEVLAAQKGRLPDLVTLEAIRGDLQSHTRASDGKATLEVMAARAREQGLAYLAITDHSRSLKVANGQSVEDLERQIEQIDHLNEQWNDFRLLKSCEVDILEGGDLDMPDEVLAKLDIVVCSIHTRFQLSREKQTERILRAMDNPYFQIFAHPTGRLIDRRQGYDLDLDRVMKEAKARGIYLEINAHPERLDLNDTGARLAKEIGVKLAISTDAHSPGELAYMRFGVDQARRGWLEADDIINTREWGALKKMIRRK